MKKEVRIEITEEMFKQWSEWAKQKNSSLNEYIINSVEGQAIKEMIINYLNERDEQEPQWEFRNF